MTAILGMMCELAFIFPDVVKRLKVSTAFTVELGSPSAVTHP